MIINWQYHFKILTNGRNTGDVYQNSRKHYIHHFNCAYTFVWPYLILKAFSIYNSVLLFFCVFFFFCVVLIFLFLTDINSLSFNIFGLFQKYFLIHCFLKSTYSVHSNKKWNSSSSLSQYLHFLSLIGVLLSLAHLPTSISSRWEETFNFVIATLNFFHIESF